MGNIQLVPAEIVERRLQNLGEKRGDELMQENRNCKLVKENWVDAFNKRDIKRILRFCSKESLCYFKGAESGMPLEAFMGECGNLASSFEDLVVTFESIREIRPGVVRVKNFKTTGTHTKPFGFGPFPKVPATNMVVDEDRCQLTLSLTGGKMTKFVIEMNEGDLVGPPGYYIKIGGKMDLVDDTTETSSVSSKSGSVRV